MFNVTWINFAFVRYRCVRTQCIIYMHLHCIHILVQCTLSNLPSRRNSFFTTLKLINTMIKIWKSCRAICIHQHACDQCKVEGEADTFSFLLIYSRLSIKTHMYFRSVFNSIMKKYILGWERERGGGMESNVIQHSKVSSAHFCCASHATIFAQSFAS